MPGIMFQDVVCPRTRANRKRYTLPISFLVHTSIIAVIIVLPAIATDVLPVPRTVMQFVTPPVPVVPAAPPARRVAPPTSSQNTAGAPVVAPETIGAERGLIFQPGDVDTKDVDSIVGGIDVGPIVADAPPPAPPAQRTPVVVGGDIKTPARTKYVAPQYPDLALKAKIQGVVIIEAIIGIDGKVEQARVLRSHPLLDDAALIAVRAWEYTPTLLNGRPTPLIMTVTVVFKLQ